MQATLVIPSRSTNQRLEALEEANRVRFYRARLKRDLRSGRLDVREVLSDVDCGTMKVVELLLALPKVGRVKANRALARTRISPSRSLGGLSERQRRELVAWLP